MPRPRNRHQHRRESASERENLIVEMWDAGKSGRMIAKELDMTEPRVMNIIGYMCVSGVDKWQKPAILATIELAARIREVHPHMVGAQ